MSKFRITVKALSEDYTNCFNSSAINFTRTVGTAGTATVTGDGQLAISNDNSGEPFIFVDNSSPVIADGKLLFTVKPTATDPYPDLLRYGIVFRYKNEYSYCSVWYDKQWKNTSPSSYVMLQFDPLAGAVFWKTGTSQGTLVPNGITFESGRTYKIEVDYEGTNLILKIDDVVKYNGTVAGIPTSAGKIGFEAWSSGINYYDNIYYYEK